jgi:hypothetical protein
MFMSDGTTLDRREMQCNPANFARRDLERGLLMNQLTSKEARLWTPWPLRLKVDADSLLK